jgi:hypothetical protein
VAQKARPAVRRTEGGCRLTGVFGIYESRRHRDEARRVRDDLDKVVGGERGCGCWKNGRAPVSALAGRHRHDGQGDRQ